MNKHLTSVIAAAIVLGTSAIAGAANLPDQCYQDAMGYAENKVSNLSANIISVSRIGEEAADQPSDDAGLANVTIELEAIYADGRAADYQVIVPVQVDDEGGCAVAGEASIRRF